MQNTFDLQIQSTASDGKHASRDLVAMARAEGLSTISITDHDTVDGVEQALLAGGELGVRVIPGIEMTVEEHNSHILGFGIRYRDPELLSTLAALRAGRIESLKKMVENLVKNEGLVVTWDDVVREARDASSFTSPHVVYATMHRDENREKLARDGVSTKHDFYEKYLRSDGPNKAKRSHLSSKDAIALLHRVGGVAVWSHPALGFQGGKYDEMEEFLKLLIGWGLDGIEVFNPTHNEDDVEILQSLAAQYTLLRTGGSDFHEKTDTVTVVVSERGTHSAQKTGDFETFGFPTENIVAELDAAIQKRKQ